MADDLEKAFIQVYDPTSSQQARAVALEYLSQLSNAPGGWRTFLEKLFSTSDVQIAVMCLSAIEEVVNHRYLALTADEHIELKEALFTFMQQIIGPGTPPPLENTLAVVIVMLFKLDFPQAWPGFFGDLATATLSTPSGLTASRENPMQSENANTLPSPDGIRVWGRVLTVIHEEVVSTDVQRSSTDAAHAAALKDAMRDLAIMDIVETWYNILLAFHEQHRDTVNNTISVMCLYIHWIDIGLIVNDRFLPLLFKLASIPDYLAKSMEIFSAIVNKGMDRDPRAKLELMHTLQLPRILAQIQGGPVEALERVAQLVNTMGVSILDCYKNIGDQIAADAELSKSTAELLQCALENLFKYYNDDFDDVSRSLQNFAKNYLQFVRMVRKMQDGVLSPEMLEHLKIMMQILHKKMRYDESYNFDDLEQEEDDFESFRSALGDQFRDITKMEPDVVFAYVGSLVSNINAMQDPFDMEVALRCLFLVGEGFVDATSATSGPAAFFIEMFRLLIDSHIFAYEEPRALVSQFFECVTRYARIFAHAQDLITPLLNHWMGKHGVLHPHGPTRARRCTNFTSFAKNLKEPLQAYLMDIVNHLRGFASFRPDSFDQVTYEEQLELFESFGVLVGHDRNDNTKHKQYIDLLVLPLVENMNNVVENKLYLQDTPHNQFHTKWLSYLIRAIGTFSKGFPLPIISIANIRRPNTSADATEAMMFFARVFDIVMQIMGALGNKEDIRSSCVFYFQRMAVCLNSGFLLPFLPVVTERLLTPLTVPNMLEYSMLLIKMVSTYSTELGDILDGQFYTIVSKVNELLQQGGATVTPQSDEERELMQLRREYYCFLNTVAGAHLASVFISPTNIAHLQLILESLLQGCSAIGDPGSQKFAFACLGQLSKEWLGEGHGPNPALPEGFADTFLTWILQNVIPLAFEIPFNPRFNLEDARSSDALQEMAALERALYAALGPQFEQYLMAQLPVTSLQCTPDVVAQYIEGLKSGSSAKQWKKFKSEFLVYHRKLR